MRLAVLFYADYEHEGYNIAKKIRSLKRNNLSCVKDSNRRKIFYKFDVDKLPTIVLYDYDEIFFIKYDKHLTNDNFKEFYNTTIKPWLDKGIIQEDAPIYPVKGLKDNTIM